MKIIFIIVAFCISIQGFSKNIKVVTTNAWTTAYAIAAGATNVHQLAPSTLMHPSEYEITFYDIGYIRTANLIVYAGYESLVESFEMILEGHSENLLKIQTGYSYEMIEVAVLKIAERLNTVTTAKQNLAEIKAEFEKGRTQIEAIGWKGRPVLVHFFQQQFAREMGFTILEIFGPAQLEAYEIVELADTYVGLIIDNKHNPAATPIVEIKKTTKNVQLLNFPGSENTETLIDVIRYNVNQILKVCSKP